MVRLTIWHHWFLRNRLQMCLRLFDSIFYIHGRRELVPLPLPWRHKDHDGVSNHRPYGCLLNRLFRRKSKKTSKLRVTGLCVGNSPGPVNSPHKGPVTRKNVSIWWRHHDSDVTSAPWHLKSPATRVFIQCLFWLTTKKPQSKASLAHCEGNASVAVGFPSQRDSKAENIFISWRHHVDW